MTTQYTGRHRSGEEMQFCAAAPMRTDTFILLKRLGSRSEDQTGSIYNSGLDYGSRSEQICYSVKNIYYRSEVNVHILFHFIEKIERLIVSIC